MNATLALTNGKLVDTATGAVVRDDDPATIPGGIVTALDTYARARVEADALALRLDDLRQPHLAAYDAALAADREYQDTLARLADARRVVDETHAALDTMLPDRTDKVSLDTGRVLVTWGKPRESWALARPASWYATAAAHRELRGLLTMYEDGAGLASYILDWLAPTSKTGDAPPVRITVRNGGGA
ncbi:MAG: hypothetical protein DYG90_04660 [Chloroflexi bacterium CFX6]|nr:hypothetical protein [Chloroflexi bacterium CFX6]